MKEWNNFWRTPKRRSRTSSGGYGQGQVIFVRSFVRDDGTVTDSVRLASLSFRSVPSAVVAVVVVHDEVVGCVLYFSNK